MDFLFQELRHSVRRLARSPGFSVLAILIVGLGIGANSAMFSVVDHFLFRPPPWDDPERVVWIYQDSDDGGPQSTSYPAFRDMLAHTETFENVAALNATTARYSTEEGDARPVEVVFATSGYFPVLKIRPFRGGWFNSAHDDPAGMPVAVVSHRAWQRMFSGAPETIGKTIRLNSQAVTVIGVGPPGFTGAVPGTDVDFWLSISAAGSVGGARYRRTLSQRADHWFRVIARLREGVSPNQAQATMDVLAQSLATDYPQFNEGRGISVFSSTQVRVHPENDGTLYRIGAVLMGIVGLFLLIACANLANLMLARASTRGREVTLRAALGASRSRLMAGLLIESGMLGIAGGAVGVLLAWWAARYLAVHQPPLPFAPTLEVSVDGRLLAFAFILSILTAMFFGVLPALQASRANLAGTLRDSRSSLDAGGARAAGLRWLSLRNTLVIGQLAVSLVLLAGAGLLVRTLLNVQNVDLGVSDAPVAVLRPDLRQIGYSSEQSRQLFAELHRRVSALPGVQAVGFTTRLPVSPSSRTTTLEIEGYEPPTGTNEAEVIFASIDTGYIEVLEIPILQGRNFNETDRIGGEDVALVNEAFARQYWGTTDAVGRRYRRQSAPESWVRIIGVTGDVKVRTPDETATPMLYRPFSQDGWPGNLYLVARTDLDAEMVVWGMRRELRQLEAKAPVYQAGTLDDHMADALALPGAAAGLLSVFALLAVVLAALGLYAVVSFAITRRTSEIGIRMAIGASRKQVVAMVLKETVYVVAAGVGTGLFLSFSALPVLQSILFDVTAYDPITYLAVAGLLVTVMLVAAYLPARRAAHADPLQALRAE